MDILDLDIERDLEGSVNHFFYFLSRFKYFPKWFVAKIKSETKHRFLFGLAEYKNGLLMCRPTIRLGSHMLTSALGANCILESESGDGPLKPGDLIKINLLPWKTI